MTDLNRPIAVKGFCVLVLDHEWNAIPSMGMNAGCYCRILNDGYFAGQIVADNRDQAIERFLSGSWIHQ